MIRWPSPSRESEAGAIAPAAAVMLAVLIGFVGLVTDTSLWFAQRRDLQAVTDAAALAAARFAGSPELARQQGEAILTANGYPATAIQRLETGWYCPKAATPGQRFQSRACDGYPNLAPNAVRLSTAHDTPILLSAVANWSTSTRQMVSLRATAAQVDQAGLEAGAGVLQLNAGLINGLLSALTGSTVNLTLADYQGLASTEIDALALLDALAIDLGLGAGTYGQLLDTEVGVGQLLDAAIGVLDQYRNLAGVSAALSGLQRLEAAVPAPQRIKLGQLFDLGLWENTRVGAGDSRTALDAGVNLFQLASFSLQLSNGGHAATIPGATIGVPGLAALKVEATVIEPPQGAFFAFGPEGTQVHTAAVRLKLGLEIPLLGTNLPLYVEAGGGDAKIAEISCRGDPSRDARVLVDGRSSVADVYVGAPRLDVMRNVSRPVTYADIQPANVIDINLLGLGLIEISTGLRGHVAVGDTSEGARRLEFVQPTAPDATPTRDRGIIGRPVGGSLSPIAPTPARVGADQVLGSLSQLAESLELSLRLCPLLCIVETRRGIQLGSIFTILDPIFTALDAPLVGLLRALGVELGYTDVFVTGVRCGVPVLIA